MNDITNAFPRRPLSILRHGAGAGWFYYLLGLSFLAATLATAWWQFPPLISDNEIRQNPVVVTDARVSNGKCKSRKFVVDCEADIAYRVDGKGYATHASLYFVDFSFDDYSVSVVRAAGKPELATLDLGIESYWNRVVTMVGFAGLMAACSFGGFLAAFRNGSLKRIGAAGPRVLEPVEAVITTGGKVLGGSSFAFTAAAAGKERKFTSRFRKDEAPLQMADGRSLAVVPRESNVAVLLDEGLQRLDLTEAERSAIRAAIGRTSR